MRRRRSSILRRGLLVASAGASLASLTAAFGTSDVRAQGPAPQAPATQASDAGASTSVTGCVETIPKGGKRPKVVEVFPERGTSGWAATLALTIEHGRGERVLPSGLDLSSASDAKKYLKQAGFVIPEQDGGAGARMWSDPDDAKSSSSLVTTHLELPVVTLPEQPGRNVMHLPPLPVAIARANGEIATVCTRPHTIVVEDPIANVPDAKPVANPPPRPQREEWTALKKAVIWGSLGVLAGAAIAYVIYRILSRPKPALPPPPPRPPWEVALEQLEAVRRARLLEEGRHMEYFDRVNDAVRGYLGARFGFDGLESTTDEILVALRKQAGGVVRFDGSLGEEHESRGGVAFEEIRAFLDECDLVKFANLKPTPEQCTAALVTGERLVRKTSPQAFAIRAGAPRDVAATTSESGASTETAIEKTSEASEDTTTGGHDP